MYASLGSSPVVEKISKPAPLENCTTCSLTPSTDSTTGLWPPGRPSSTGPGVAAHESHPNRPTAYIW